MASIRRFLSASIGALVEGLEAGTEEGLRMELERVKEEERVVENARKERQRIGVEELRGEAVAQEVRTNADEEDVMRKRDEIRAGKQEERADKKAFWTTPGLRPLAEPPILDWDWFFRTWIPSDLRYKALFPQDPEKRAAMKDLNGELNVLSQYRWVTVAFTSEPEAGSERAAFYEKLSDVMLKDWIEVEEEYLELYDKATYLSKFEFKYLDNDGKTTGLEQWVSKGADILNYADEEVKRKYQHLVPPNFVEKPLATFEFYWLLMDGGTGSIEFNMRNGIDTLVGWPQEVQEKYGYIRHLLPRPPPIVPGTPTSIHSEGRLKADQITMHLDNLRPADRPREGRPRAHRRWSVSCPSGMDDRYGVIQRLWPYPPPHFGSRSSSSQYTSSENDSETAELSKSYELSGEED